MIEGKTYYRWVRQKDGREVAQWGRISDDCLTQQWGPLPAGSQAPPDVLVNSDAEGMEQ